MYLHFIIIRKAVIYASCTNYTVPTYTLNWHADVRAHPVRGHAPADAAVNRDRFAESPYVTRSLQCPSAMDAGPEPCNCPDRPQFVPLGSRHLNKETWVVSKSRKEGEYTSHTAFMPSILRRGSVSPSSPAYITRPRRNRPGPNRAKSRDGGCTAV